jgi:hypothetical protein
MDGLICSLQALLACFSWSNLYVHGGLSYEDVRYYEFSLATNDAVAVSGNPLGDIGIGFRADISRRLTVDLRMFGHRSSLSSGGDRGVNYAMLSVDWRPFRH